MSIWNILFGKCLRLCTSFCIPVQDEPDWWLTVDDFALLLESHEHASSDGFTTHSELGMLAWAEVTVECTEKVTPLCRRLLI